MDHPRSRSLVLLCALAPLFAACASSGHNVADLSGSELTELARGIHERVITLDTHCDFRVSNFTEERHYAMELDSQVTLPKMEQGGLDVAWFIVFTGQGELDEAGYAAAYDRAIAKFDAIWRLCDELAPEQIELALDSDDVRRIVASGKKVAMIGVENGYPIGLDLGLIREFQERGGRYMSLCHQGHNQLADSNTGERDDAWVDRGLSELGRDAVREMNRWGLMIDLSHPSKQSNLQAIELSRAPVIASHSSARALNDVSRNLDDEELLAVRANGGVVQAVAFRAYVDVHKDAAWRAAAEGLRTELAAELGIELLGRDAYPAMSETERTAYEDRMRRLREALEPRLAALRADTPPVDVADFIDHVDYLVDLIGIEHVGISSDFDGGGGVDGWKDASETFNVTLELVRRGYSEEQIGLLWSGNLLRVLDEVQRVAAEIQAEG